MTKSFDDIGKLIIKYVNHFHDYNTYKPSLTAKQNDKIFNRLKRSSDVLYTVIKNLCKENQRLKAEIEQLKGAGDA